MWQLTDGQFTYKFWTVSLPVKVAADGTFKGETQYTPTHGRPAWLRVEGSIAGGALQADAEWRACQVHYSLNKM